MSRPNISARPAGMIANPNPGSTPITAEGPRIAESHQRAARPRPSHDHIATPSMTTLNAVNASPATAPSIGRPLPEFQVTELIAAPIHAVRDRIHGPVDGSRIHNKAAHIVANETADGAADERTRRPADTADRRAEGCSADSERRPSAGACALMGGVQIGAVRILGPLIQRAGSCSESVATKLREPAESGRPRNIRALALPRHIVAWIVIAFRTLPPAVIGAIVLP